MLTRLSVENLSIARGERTLFEGLGFGLNRGEAVMLTGPNGAGKTSLLRAVAGLLRPRAGTIQFDGEDGSAEAEAVRADEVHYLGHQDGLKPARTVWAELRFQALWTGGSETSAREAARRLGLEPLLDLEVRKLSAGQRRRAALARLLAAHRRLWLLDEPMTPLDADRRSAFAAVMREHLGDGGMILAAVHDPLPIPARVVEIGAPGVKAFLTLFRRELDLAWGGGGGPMLGCAFLACVTTLLPLSAGPSLARLGAIAPGAAWVALALASLLSLERLFERDFEDGALDLLALGPLPVEVVALAKCLAQWVANGLPLAAAAPIAALALGARPELSLLTFACAAIGGLGFACVGGVGAAVALGARRGGVLIAVIVLPLFSPPVIFGAGAIENLASGLSWTAGLGFLAAYSLAALALSPFAMAAAVRNALD